MKYLDIISESLLFYNIPLNDLKKLLDCLAVRVINVKKNNFVIQMGDSIKDVGLLLDGELQIIKEDIDGNNSLMAKLEPRDYFAEVFCCANVEYSPISVMASKDSTILLIDYQKIINKCSDNCGYHNTLISNMLSLVANKTLAMQVRTECLSQKSVRKKILRYLSIASKNQKSFSIPFDRADLADYLCIDRSALSRELSRLKDEGVIDYWKNHFKIND